MKGKNQGERTQSPSHLMLSAYRLYCAHDYYGAHDYRFHGPNFHVHYVYDACFHAVYVHDCRDALALAATDKPADGRDTVEDESSNLHSAHDRACLHHDS